MKVIALSLQGPSQTRVWEHIQVWSLHGPVIRLLTYDGAIQTEQLPMHYVGVYQKEEWAGEAGNPRQHHTRSRSKRV